jgi:hypothetical protein
MVRTRKRARQDPSCVVPYLDRGFGLAGHGNIMIMPTITEFSQPIQPNCQVLVAAYVHTLGSLRSLEHYSLHDRHLTPGATAGQNTSG